MHRTACRDMDYTRDGWVFFVCHGLESDRGIRYIQHAIPNLIPTLQVLPPASAWVHNQSVVLWCGVCLEERAVFWISAEKLKICTAVDSAG